MLVEIALQWTFIFINNLKNEIHENWHLTNVDETTIQKLTLNTHTTL